MASTNSYSSSIDLYLSQVPTSITDPAIYKALLDIHNALEILAQYTDTGSELDVGGYIAKLMGFVVVNDSYNIQATDGSTILASSTSGDIVVTLPSVTDLDITGYVYEIKHVAGDGIVTVQGEGASTIDGDSYILYSGEAIPVKCDGSNWYVYQ